MVVLKLSGDTLQQFASPKIKGQNNTIKSNDNSSPASSTELPTVRPSSADNGSDADAISTPATGATAGDTPRRMVFRGPTQAKKSKK
jgi:hypothetical protein